MHGLPLGGSTATHPNLDRWERLIEDGDASDLHRVMTGLDVDSVEMREVSPMRGLLSQSERSEILGPAS